MEKRTEEDQRAIDNLSEESLEGAAAVYYVGHKAGRHSVYKEQEPSTRKAFAQFIGIFLTACVCVYLLWLLADTAYKQGESDAYLDMCKRVEASYDVPPEDSPCKLFAPKIKLSINIK